MDFTNDADMIWLNTNNKDSFIIFGLYYELFKNITEYSELDIDREEFKKVYYLALFKYLKKIDRDINDYKVIFDGFLDYFSNYYQNNEFKEIINLYKNDVENINDAFPWINIINKLGLSYVNKVPMNIVISDYLSTSFGTLNAFYSEEDRDKIFEKISSNIFDYITDIDTRNFDINLFSEQLLYINKSNLDNLIDNNIFDINDLDIDVSNLDKDELKIFIHYIRIGLIGGMYDPVIGYKGKRSNNDLKMSKLRYSVKSKSLHKKMNKYFEE